MKKLVLVLTVVLTLVLAGQCALADYSAKVLTSKMDVYLSPKDSKPVAQLAQGTPFTVTAISGEWARVFYRGKTGYAQMQNIMFDKAIPARALRDTSVLFVSRESYKIRLAYWANIAAGTRVYVRGMSHGKLLITNASGNLLGFVDKADFVRITDK